MKAFPLAIAFVIISAFAVFAQPACQRHVEAEGGFSYCPPNGWTSKLNPGTKFHRFFAPAGADGRSWANFNVRDAAFTGTLAAFVQANINDLTTPRTDRNPSVYKVISRTDIATGSKLKGVRIVMQYELQGRQVQAISYIFDGKGGTKVVFSSTMLMGDTTTPKLLDAMIQTFRFDS